ncbi:MAG: FAD/NAD(P)-binding protein [Marmoricola sp.]
MTARRATVAIAGAGAAGTLTALHLVRSAARRSTSLKVVVVDPRARFGTGTAFGTLDAHHLLNVPASGMSAFPEDPGHFISWRRRTGSPTAGAYEFAPRRAYARYLDEALRGAIAEANGEVCVDLIHQEAVGVERSADGLRLRLDDATQVDTDALVLATGLTTPSTSWASEGLRRSPFFVPDPWSAGALDVVARDSTGPAEVLLVGTGLTMVDVALTLAQNVRAGRVLHAISRSGRLAHRHAPAITVPVIPETADWGRSLDDIRNGALLHLREVEAVGGDWRPAVDGIRFQIGALWGRLSEEDRRRFLAEDASAWNRLRHRMAPESADAIERLIQAGILDVEASTVVDAEPLAEGGLRVTLSSGVVREVGWVVNCTGPRTDVRTLGNPLLDDLLRVRTGNISWATAATAGLGLRTHEGRLVESLGRISAPVWAIGALRRGDLWESTAVPEIRTQALSLASAILDEVAPLPRRLADGRLVGGRHPIARPRDLLGLPLSTTADAAAAYNAGLEKVMRLQEGAAELLAEAVVVDPSFALGHAALALLGHESGAEVDVAANLLAAEDAVTGRGDERERSLVDTIARRVRSADRAEGDAALLAHVAAHPRDVLAVSAAVPTIAFSGVTDIRHEAWELVEGLGPAYGDHWWYLSLLAFTRQDQGRFEEASFLAEDALACEPASGHAAHALTHVLYETGRHEVGRSWLDHWISANGRSANHRAHFSWHASLHELALGDTEAVRQRYYAQLAPPTVTGVRALVDSASLLWRWQIAAAPCWGLDDGPVPPIAPVLEAVDPSILHAPQTPFVALHAAIALAAGRRLEELQNLIGRCRDSKDAVMATLVATVGEALLATCEERFAEAADLLVEVLPRLEEVGGSAAQREVIEETLLYCLVQSSRPDQVRVTLTERLSRRDSLLDARRLALV